MSGVSKVELYAAIRRDAHSGMSQRALTQKYNVGQKTVKQALASAWPAPRKPYPKRGSKIDDHASWIDEVLRNDLTAPRKQRHTVTRIFDRLVKEQGMSEISYDTVRRYVATRKPQILREAGRSPSDAFVPQTHLPAMEAEVDFGDVHVKLRGELTKLTLFCFRLSYSGKAAHRISATGGQEAFFEGHAHAFRVLGGIPVGKIRYDNLKSAVDRVIGFSRLRDEAERWTAFRSHYGFDAFYCQPGIQGAHEKGGVEGQIGWYRRNHLVPVPEVDSIAELNAMVDAWDVEDEDRRIGSRPHTVGEYFAIEQPHLAALPEDHFESGRWFNPRVDRYAQVTVRMNKYSVPAHLIGRQVRVRAHASELVMYDNRTEVARHERLMGKGEVRLDLDHYLEVLQRKPGALPGATALQQARAAGKFTPAHDAWWAGACKAHGDAEGTRALIQVLLLHRHMRHADVVAGITRALNVGAFTADAVGVEARLVADQDSVTPAAVESSTPAASPGTVPTVASLTERRLRQLPADTRPLPTVDKYDDLLPSRRTARKNPT